MLGATDSVLLAGLLAISINGSASGAAPVAEDSRKTTAPQIAATEAGECIQDVGAAVSKIATSYAGYSDKRIGLGGTTVDEASQRLQRAAASVASAEACDQAIADYLGMYRDAHLSLGVRQPNGNYQRQTATSGTAHSQTADDDRSPRAYRLGKDAVVIVIPSFGYEKVSVKTLLRDFDADIRKRPHLIIDLRGNSGGADSSWQPLIPYLYTDPIVTTGVDVLATKDNADAWERLAANSPAEMAADRDQLMQIVEKMRSAPEGSFVSLAADSTETLPTILPRPSRISILIDGSCASATEQFLLAAGQSKKVTLFGKPTGGVLDYSNVRFFFLPSGKRGLALPTTRSRRLPDKPIDNIGISPDVVMDLPASDGAIEWIRKYWKQQRATLER